MSTEMAFYSNDVKAMETMQKDFDSVFRACAKENGKVDLKDFISVYFPLSAGKVYFGSSDARGRCLVEAGDSWTKDFKTRAFEIRAEEYDSLSPSVAGVFAAIAKKYYPGVETAYVASPGVWNTGKYARWDPDDMIEKKGGDYHITLLDSNLLNDNYKYKNSEYGSTNRGYNLSSPEDFENLFGPLYEKTGKEGETMKGFVTRLMDERKIRVWEIEEKNPYTDLPFSKGKPAKDVLPALKDDSTPSAVLKDFAQKGRDRGLYKDRYNSK